MNFWRFSGTNEGPRPTDPGDQPTKPTSQSTQKDTHKPNPRDNSPGKEAGDKTKPELKGSREISSRDLASVELIAAKYQIAEWERKNHVLSESLSEKAEENIALQEENKSLATRVKQLESQLARLEESNADKDQETAAKSETNKELLRRLETMSESLSAMANENLQLKSQSPSGKIMKGATSGKLQPTKGNSSLL